MKIKALSGIIAMVMLTGLSFMSCNDKDADHKKGTAIGNDYSLCACCGGMFVRYQSDTLLFPDVPQEVLEWVALYGFPLEISFDYEDIEGPCFPYQKRMTYVELLEHP